MTHGPTSTHTSDAVESGGGERPHTGEEHPATEAMQRLKRHWESPVSRAGMRLGIGVRVVHPRRWAHPGHPREFAAAVTGPLLVVHGEDDAYFPVADAEAIAAAAPRATLWREPVGFGHAEDGFTPGFAARLAAAVTRVADTGDFPDRAEAGGPA